MNFDPLCHEHICRRHPFDLECSACGETIVGNDPWDQRIKHVAEHFTTMANNVDHKRLLTLWAYNERLMIYVGHNIYRPTSWHDIKDLMVRERRGYDEIPNRYQSRVDLSSKEELTFQFTEKKKPAWHCRNDHASNNNLDSALSSRKSSPKPHEQLGKAFICPIYSKHIKSKSELK